MFKIKCLITGLILSAAFLAFTTEEASAAKIVVTVYGDEGVSTDNVCGGEVEDNEIKKWEEIRQID